MEIQTSANQYSKTVAFKKDDTTLVMRKINDEYIRIETSPHDKETSFSINLAQKDMTEWSALQSFQDLLQSLIGAYYLYPSSEERVVVNPEERFIAFKSDSCDPNVLRMDYDQRATAVTITIYKNPKHYYSNNCIILKRDGMPFGSFYECFSSFIEDYETKQKTYQKKF